MADGIGDDPEAVAVSETAPVPLEAGRVGRAHGLDGSFYVIAAHLPGSPHSRLLDVGTRVTVAGHTHAITRHAGLPQRPIVRLEGIEDRSAAQALRGLPLLVSPDQAPALAEGEWWAHELEGCAVLDGERRVGTVSRLLQLPSCEVLEVRREAGGELLVPMVADAVRHVDVSAGRIDVSLDFLGETET
jgi:16S rRNA processing protein RimM